MIIGYYFHSADNWGIAAERVFSDSERNYTSTSVWQECFGIEDGGRCRTIYQGITREFRRAIAHLKQGKTPTSLLTESGTWCIHDILQDAVIAHGSDPHALLTVFIDVKERYDEVCVQRRDDLENRDLLLLHRRSSPYRELYGQFHGVIEDDDDIEIVLDAHDLACHVEGIVMITGDFRGIAVNKKIILASTNLTNIRYLDEFE